MKLKYHEDGGEIWTRPRESNFSNSCPGSESRFIEDVIGSKPTTYSMPGSMGAGFDAYGWSVEIHRFDDQ